MPKYTVYVNANFSTDYEVEAADEQHAISTAELLFVNDYAVIQGSNEVAWESIEAYEVEEVN
jgi:hypothetical protein